MNRVQCGFIIYITFSSPFCLREKGAFSEASRDPPPSPYLSQLKAHKHACCLLRLCYGCDPDVRPTINTADKLHTAFLFVLPTLPHSHLAIMATCIVLLVLLLRGTSYFSSLSTEELNNRKQLQLGFPIVSPLLDSVDFQILEFKEIFWFLSPEPGPADTLSVDCGFCRLNLYLLCFHLCLSRTLPRRTQSLSSQVCLNGELK